MDDTKIALVTGANKGIGFEVARLLGRAGVTVLLGARDPGRGAEAAERLRADGLPATPVRLDVTDPASVTEAAKRIEDGYGRLDILVNNAGIMTGWGRPSELSVDDLRQAYETNVFGVVAVTNAMLPLLRRGSAARIVNVSSSMGSLTRMAAPESGIPMMTYSSSKAALNGLTVAYAAELREADIKVNSADPGYCATDLNQHTGPRDPADGAAVVVRLALLDPDGPSGTFEGDTGPVPW
ncbi:SDR family oxidoreductase [Plantactinospora soyae]|uniref:NAD(P)-dependent dehydrogenase (Short-subunit alcohol dehydrogenase family) n=1 Tax=Plantactinospora soyae TaxID=1544732 RepID=A0A927M0Z9_9ACTN|nr:SDR family oxidoreductase [Plantactinospora soyae]MBE1484850.1 NAD(P)-dependent dehydrogenase (short-subunit alcohol dehydrogenase family) [Plantactinospora soyae]